MVGWHQWLDEHEFEQAPGVGDGQGSLVCCSPRGCKESDTTEQLNWTELIFDILVFVVMVVVKSWRRRDGGGESASIYDDGGHGDDGSDTSP